MSGASSSTTNARSRRAQTKAASEASQLRVLESQELRSERRKRAQRRLEVEAAVRAAQEARIVQEQEVQERAARGAPMKPIDCVMKAIDEMQTVGVGSDTATVTVIIRDGPEIDLVGLLDPKNNKMKDAEDDEPAPGDSQFDVPAGPDLGDSHLIDSTPPGTISSQLLSVQESSVGSGSTNTYYPLNCSTQKSKIYHLSTLFQPKNPTKLHRRFATALFTAHAIVGSSYGNILDIDVGSGEGHFERLVIAVARKMGFLIEDDLDNSGEEDAANFQVQCCPSPTKDDRMVHEINRLLNPSIEQFSDSHTSFSTAAVHAFSQLFSHKTTRTPDFSTRFILEVAKAFGIFEPESQVVDEDVIGLDDEPARDDDVMDGSHGSPSIGSTSDDFGVGNDSGIVLDDGDDGAVGHSIIGTQTELKFESNKRVDSDVLDASQSVLDELMILEAEHVRAQDAKDILDVIKLLLLKVSEDSVVEGGSGRCPAETLIPLVGRSQNNKRPMDSPETSSKRARSDSEVVDCKSFNVFFNAPTRPSDKDFKDTLVSLGLMRSSESEELIDIRMFCNNDEGVWNGTLCVKGVLAQRIEDLLSRSDRVISIEELNKKVYGTETSKYLLITEKIPRDDIIATTYLLLLKSLLQFDDCSVDSSQLVMKYEKRLRVEDTFWTLPVQAFQAFQSLSQKSKRILKYSMISDASLEHARAAKDCLEQINENVGLGMAPTK